MKKLLVILLATTLFSCNNEVETKEDQISKILVLGNSITKSPPGGEWIGNWGMAASSPYKDFCYLVKQELNAETLEAKSIAVWESNVGYDVNQILSPTTEKYDYIILKVGENVSLNEISTYKDRFKTLCGYLENYTDNLIIVSTVWSEFIPSGEGYIEEHNKDRLMQEVAQENNYKFADISGIINKRMYFAWDEYQDGAIGSHPNDLGMEFIANKIIQEIQ